MTTNEFTCPDCATPRADPHGVCEACGAPPRKERESGPGSADRENRQEEGVRTTDLEPYVTLRYIAKLFKVLAGLMVIMLIGEVITGLMMQGSAAVVTLIGEATRFLVLAGLLWAAGDLAVLLIDLGHDIRVSRILLGRINAELHRRGHDDVPLEQRRRA